MVYRDCWCGHWEGWFVMGLLGFVLRLCVFGVVGWNIDSIALVWEHSIASQAISRGFCACSEFRYCRLL
jgi:hypothetical protein